MFIKYTFIKYMFIKYKIKYRKSFTCQKIGTFWRNYVNGRNDNTRKLLIGAANLFESVRSDRVIQLHPLGNHFNFNDGRKCVGATSF